MKIANKFDTDQIMTPLQQKIAEQTDLPSLARNIHALIHAMTNEELNLRQLAQVIKRYPEITTRLIFLANSPWCAPAKPIGSIEQACSILGTAIIKSVSFGISITSSFDTRKCPDFSVARFWTNNILVAEGAGLLASKLPNSINCLEFEQTAQTAGVLHNIGLLWLAGNLPEETSKALQSVSAKPALTVSEALQQCTGANYCEVGGWLGEKLKLPKVLIVAMKSHLDHNYQEESWETALLVGASATMVSALYHQSSDATVNTRLKTLGIASSTQESVFQQLSDKLEKTQELAMTLFTGQ